jgi:hypothetical protein
MVASPSSLFAPGVLLPVLADSLAGLVGKDAKPSEEYALSPTAIARLRVLPAPPMEATHAGA